MASSFSSWLEIAVFSLAFVAILGIIVTESGGFNDLYSGSNTIPFSDNSGANKSLIEYKQTASDAINEGEVTNSQNYGITLKNSFGLVKEAIHIIWDFISGSWITNLAKALDLGPAMMVLAQYLQVLFFIGMVFFVIYIIFKVMP